MKNDIEEKEVRERERFFKVYQLLPSKGKHRAVENVVFLLKEIYRIIIPRGWPLKVSLFFFSKGIRDVFYDFPLVSIQS